jgi:hypothetical protein
MFDPQMSALLVELGYDPKSVEALVSGALYLTIVSVVAAIPTGVIARRKGRSVTGWVIFALSVPLLPLLIVWLLSGKDGKPPPERIES